MSYGCPPSSARAAVDHRPIFFRVSGHAEQHCRARPSPFAKLAPSTRAARTYPCRVGGPDHRRRGRPKSQRVGRRDSRYCAALWGPPDMTGRPRGACRSPANQPVARSTRGRNFQSAVPTSGLRFLPRSRLFPLMAEPLTHTPPRAVDLTFASSSNPPPGKRMSTPDPHEIVYLLVSRPFGSKNIRHNAGLHTGMRMF